MPSPLAAYLPEDGASGRPAFEIPARSGEGTRLRLRTTEKPRCRLFRRCHSKKYIRETPYAVRRPQDDVARRRDASGYRWSHIQSFGRDDVDRDSKAGCWSG